MRLEHLLSGEDPFRKVLVLVLLVGLFEYIKRKEEAGSNEQTRLNLVL